MPDNTPRLTLPYLLQSQADKHVSVNDALSRLDTLVQLSVKSQTLTTPPTTPSNGDAWIIGPGVTSGAWINASTGSVMMFSDSGWVSASPRVGWLAFVESDRQFVVWDSGQWGPLSEQLNCEPSANLWMNSSFEIWQRGDTHALLANQPKFTADRWCCTIGTGGTANVSRVSLSVNINAPSWVRDGLRLHQTQASTTPTLLEQRIEDVTTQLDQTLTIAFWARASASMQLTPIVTQNFGTAASAPSSSSGNAIQLTTGWARHVVQVSVAGITTQTIGPNSYISVGLNGPIGQTYWFEIVLPTCASGSIASLPKKPAPGNTLRQCHRYFCKTFPPNTQPASNTQDIGGPFESAYSTVAYGNLMSWQFPTAMRKIPTITTYNPYSAAMAGMAIAGSGNYAVDAYSLTELGVLLRNTQVLGFAPTPVNLHVTADAEL